MRQIGFRRRVIYRFFISLLLITAVVLIFSVRSSAENKEQSYKYYTSVKVEEGDTVWSIAGDHYTVDYKDMNEYIYEIKRLNHLSNDLIIHEGSYITIPYYDVAVK